jgi:adenosine deaminase
MLEKGLKATINSDDPAYFGGYINANWHTIAKALDLSKDELVTLAHNSFNGSYLTAGEKQTHAEAIEAWAARF